MNGFKKDGVPVVRSLAGRDKGEIYVIVGRDDFFFELSDGKKRPLQHTKKKRIRHADVVGTIPADLAEWLREAPKRPAGVKDAEIRKALISWKDTHIQKGIKNGKGRRN